MLQPDQQLGPYRIISQVGAGGMATVFKAYHERLERYVAIKVMHQAFQEDPSFHTRFAREAKIIARLDHPNIVTVYDYAEVDGQPYLVMKYVEGRTLKQTLIKQTITSADVLRIMTPLADALDYAHRMGVLHRDIKPSNIIIDPNGTPYLTDFGMARIAQTGESTISADMMLGTPQYIAPEQALGKQDLDARTDLYSFGVVLYELIVGQVPFTGDTPYAVIHDHIYRPLPQPSSLKPDVSPEVEAVLVKALAKAPEERYGSAHEMMDALRAAFDKSDAAARPPAKEAATSADAAPGAMTAATAAFAGIPAPVPPKLPAIEEPRRKVEFKLDLGSSELNDELRKAGREISAAFREVSDEFRSERDESKAKRGWQNWDGDRQAREWNEWVENHEAENDENLKEMPADEETFLRRRIGKRIEARNGFIGHLAAYVGVNALLWTIFIFAQNGMEGFMSADGQFPWPMLVSTFWLSGLGAHAVGTFFSTGERASQRDRATLNEMRTRYGADWFRTATKKQYRDVRRRVTAASRELQSFLEHLAAYIGVNGGLWSIFLATNNFNMDSGFPWPIFVTLGWGIGIVANAMQVLFGQRKEPDIERQVARELALEGGSEKPKRKNDGIRLTDDGELTDSMIDEIESEDPQRRRR